MEPDPAMAQNPAVEPDPALAQGPALPSWKEKEEQEPASPNLCPAVALMRSPGPEQRAAITLSELQQHGDNHFCYNLDLGNHTRLGETRSLSSTAHCYPHGEQKYFTKLLITGTSLGPKISALKMRVQ